MGLHLPPELGAEIAALAKPGPEAGWGETVARLAAVEEHLRRSAAELVSTARARALDVARWGGLTAKRLAEFERRLPDAEAAAREGRTADALETIQRELATGLPEALERRRAIREEAGRLRSAAEEVGAPTRELDAALAQDQDAAVARWPETTGEVQKAANELGDTVRERSVQALESLKGTLGGLSEYGVDPSAARTEVEAALARVADLTPVEIGPVLKAARSSAEEPIVTVVAGLLDEVRPRLAGARRLGRDPTEVFGAMNRAREALRLKIYSEALAASQEALEKVRRLTQDVDAARDELTALEEMVGRFRRAGFSSGPADSGLGKIRDRIERGEVDEARQALATAVRNLGKEALAFFLERWSAVDQAREFAESRGFGPEDAASALGKARELLDGGDLSAGAEGVAHVESELRAAAAPYVARRIEEMQQGFLEIGDEALTGPVRRLLADTDVTLRVKEDLPRAIESLKKAEREFQAVFAAQASAFVEGLEAEVRVLESMGGAGDEIQRQIDEIQQIFNLGDFVKASRASQELKARAQEQQQLRSEEAISHAKLSLVELETMGLDLTKLRTELDAAQDLARDGKHLDAYRTASELETRATASRGAAGGVLERFTEVDRVLADLRSQGADLAPFVEPLRKAREAFRALSFDVARQGAVRVEDAARAELARLDTLRQANEIGLLLDEGRRFSAPLEPFATRLEKLKTELATGAPEATRTALATLHEELLAVLRPHLDEHLRAVEHDLDLARSVGVPLEPIVAQVAEARRRIALPVPTGAASLLDEARAALVATRGFVEQAEKAVRRAHDVLAQAEVLRVDLASLRPKVEHLEKLLAARDFARTIELGGTTEREIAQATYQHVSKIVAGFQASVTQLRRAGANTSIAENLLHQARAELDDGHPVEALQLAARSEGELERVDLQQRIAEGALAAIERAVARSKQEGIRLPRAEDALDATRAAFGRGDFLEVLEQSISVSEAVAEGRDGKRRAEAAIQAAERQIKETSELGAEPGDAAARLAEAREEAAAGHFAEAIRLSGEATEQGRWAIERMFSAPVSELRAEVETAKAAGLAREVGPLDETMTEAEEALRAGAWPKVRAALNRAETASKGLYKEVVEARLREIEATAGAGARPSEAEAARRKTLRGELGRLEPKRDLKGALQLLATELETVRAERQESITKAMAEFKDRLWIGERLGLDTTPVMQAFSEARGALEAGRFDPAEESLAKAREMLDETAKGPLTRRRKELETEVTFAEEGLHVAVGPVKARLKEADRLLQSGAITEAGKIVLKAVEEVNQRKALHRELTNLHYLLDAALSRASELGVDASEARRLLAESLRLRESDYPAALEKAREALRTLRDRGVTVTDTAAPATSSGILSPFRRSPPG